MIDVETFALAVVAAALAGSAIGAWIVAWMDAPADCGAKSKEGGAR